VYLAREAPIGVVLRRGPSAWVQLSVWHTDTDMFEHGQWMKCRVYERRSDLSADGSLFAYFARGTPRASGPDNPSSPADSWVAISRPPYFTALALWFVGGTYHTGAYFPDRRSVWSGFTQDPPDQGRLPAGLALAPRLPPYVDRTNEWTERTVFINRLLRDGWERAHDSAEEVWQRPNPAGNLTLLMTLSAPGIAGCGGRSIADYALQPQPDGEVMPLGRATWADWDHRGRLVLARDGRLFQWQPSGSLQQIADFNPLQPEPRPAPPWATSWPRKPM
jgi:hypothetical protein